MKNEKDLSQENISFSVGFNNNPITFHLRMISVAEENKLRQRFTALSEDEKELKDYELNVDALAEFSINAPTIKKMMPVAEQPAEADENQEPKMEFQDVQLTGITPGLPGQVIRDYFADRTASKERIADFAVRAFLSRLTPDVSFL